MQKRKTALNHIFLISFHEKPDIEFAINPYDQFETQEGKTILQSGIEQNVPLPFSCQSGLCGMCKMKCTEGKVMIKNNQVLTEKDIKEGYILTCQSLPQTKAITINNP